MIDDKGTSLPSSSDNINIRPPGLPKQLVQFLSIEVLNSLPHYVEEYTPNILEHHAMNYFLRIKLYDFSESKTNLTEIVDQFDSEKKYEFYKSKYADQLKLLTSKCSVDKAGIDGNAYRLGVGLKSLNYPEEVNEIIRNIMKPNYEENAIVEKLNNPINSTTDIVNLVINYTFPVNPRTFFGTPPEFHSVLAAINNTDNVIKGYRDQALLLHLKAISGGFTHREHILARKIQEEAHPDLDVMSSGEWLKERGPRAKEEWYTFNSNHKKYRQPSENELKNAIHLLSDDEPAKKLAIDKLSRMT